MYDNICKAIAARELPITLNENAALIDLHKFISCDLFKIDKCLLPMITNSDCLSYPLIEFRVKQVQVK